jgi:hypothetical protein
MIFKLSDLRKTFLYFVQGPKFYGGGAPPSQSTSVTQATIPDELKPYVSTYMGAAEKQLYQKNAEGEVSGFQPYKAYGNTLDKEGNLVLDSQGKPLYDSSKGIAGFSAMQQQAQTGAAGMKNSANFGTASTLAGSSGTGSLNAGQNYQNQMTDPNSVQAYMSPYMQNVTNQQIAAANRQYDISGAQQMGNATQQKAFGGSREALMAAENERGRNTAIGNIQATGLQSAFTNAQQQQQNVAQLGLQGMSQASQAASTLGNLGAQDLAAQQGILTMQNTMGAQQTAKVQAAKDQAMLDYANAQNKPMQDIGTMSSLVRGISTTPSSATTYTAQPSTMSQIGGLAATGIGAYGALKANGGVIEDRGYADGGIVGYKLGGDVEESMRNKLEDLDNPRLQEIIKENESPEMTKIAKEVMRSNYAKGGIVAFAQGGQPAASWLSQLEGVSQEMKNKAYKLHGWTDEDVANYQSSKRVPLDPNKGLAQIPGESATINTNKEPLRSTRFTPEETAPYESSIESGKELSTKVKKHSKERMAYEAERAAREAAREAAPLTESAPSPSSSDPWAERSNTDVRGQLKKGYGALKSGIASLATPENIAAAGSEINAQRFKEGLGSESTLSSVEQGVLGGPSLAPELVKHLIENGTGGPIGEQFRKTDRFGLATALDKFGDSASKRYEIIKNWATTPVGGNKGIAAVETPEPVVAKKIEPMVAPAPMGQMQNETQTQTQTQTARPSVPAQEGRNTTSVMNQGTTAQANAPTQSEDSVLSRLEASRDSAEKEANMSVEDRVKSQKEMEERLVGKDEDTAAYRKSIMDERANAPDEARRQMSMRLMEFGASWASTPGAPLVAGMKAITATLPGLMEDTKANKKMMKDLDKSEYLLNHATRLEELGRFKDATAAKEKASELFLKYDEELVAYGLKQQEIQSAEKIARLAQFGATTRTSMEQEGRSDPRAVTPTGRLASIDKELADLSRDKTGSPNPAKFKYTQEQLDTIAKLKRERAELRGDRPQYQAPRPKDPAAVNAIAGKYFSKEAMTAPYPNRG